MSEKIFNAVIYCRLSKEDCSQTDKFTNRLYNLGTDKIESNSISNQCSFCEDFIAKQSDIKIVRSPIIDDGISGVSFERNGFKELEEEIRNGRVNCVVCKDLSRFSRNYIEGGRYLERIFPSLGVRFIAICDNYDSLNSNKYSDAFMLPFKNLTNEFYCKDISMKIRSSLEIKRKKGDYVANYSPYGYKKSLDNPNKLVIDEDTYKNVKLIFSLFKDGLSLAKIADRLNELGILSPMEYKQATSNFESSFKTNEIATWSYKSIKRILSNEVYIGVLAQGKRTTPNYKVKIVQTKDENDWIRVENAHKPIISYEDFNIVREMLKRDVRSLTTFDEENTLSGFIFCGDCGGTMVRKVVSSKKKKYVYYICSNYKKDKSCNSHNISSCELKDVILNILREQISIVLDFTKLSEYETFNTNTDLCSYDTHIKSLNHEIEKCSRLKLKLYEDFTENVINKNDYLEFNSHYESMINNKSLFIKKLEKEKIKANHHNSEENKRLFLFKEHKTITELNRRILISLVDKIYIYENRKIQIVFRFQNEFLNLINTLKENEIRCSNG